MIHSQNRCSRSVYYSCVCYGIWQSLLEGPKLWDPRVNFALQALCAKHSVASSLDIRQNVSQAKDCAGT